MQKFVEHTEHTQMLSYTGYTTYNDKIGHDMIIFLERMSGVGESVVDLWRMQDTGSSSL